MLAFLKRLWQRSTVGEVVYTVASPINGRVVVKRDLIGFRVIVGNLTQSGGQLRVVWQKALKLVKQESRLSWSPQRILLLGLGAGTNAQLVRRFWPSSQVTAVELDPVMVEIGRRFFDLDRLKNLTIKITDAVAYVATEAVKKPGQFDLILVDLYLGQDYPPQAESEEFLANLKHLLANEGRLIVNRLCYREHQIFAVELTARIKESFPRIKRQRIGGNLLIHAFSTTPA